MRIHDTDEEARNCPGCGAPESQWAGYDSKGFLGRNGELYCCESCASGKACSCSVERLEALVKKRSA